ncbi:MAG TPA: TIM barrel protein [Tepidisphaeraceae bacterium]|jgi:hydroxypyruvate isomerase
MLTESTPGISRRDMLAGAAALAAAGVATHSSRAAQSTGEKSSEGPVIRNGRINQTLCKWCYTKLSLEQLCQAAVRLGYKGIDLVGPEAFPTLKKYKLVGTMTTTHSIPKGLNRKENWDECLGKIRTAIDATSEAGFPNVITFSGNCGGMDLDEGMKNCAEGLKQVVGYAEEKKVTICMELLNSKVNHPDYMCDHSPWGVALVKRVGSERFKLLYDIYHMQIMEGDVIHTIKDNKDYFGHYHTAGVPGRHEIDDTQELFYPAVMRAIVETGYKGYVGQEFLPKHDTIASITQAARICDV